MDSTQQLIKKDFQNGGYRDIFPKNYTENIRDKETGEFLDVSLAKVNFLFLPYHISPEHTRLQVPESRRRLGLWISYVIPNEHRLVIEYYLSDNIEDSYWSNDAYWFDTNGSIVDPDIASAVEQIREYVDDKTLLNSEDLNRNENHEIQFSDKDYNPTEFSGLGRVYLRKNISNGKNILTQEMISNPNTRYIIQYDYDLNEETINVPEGCILDFQGGSFNNGQLTSKYIKVYNGHFINCTVRGINGLDAINCKSIFTTKLNSIRNTSFLLEQSYDDIIDNVESFVNIINCTIHHIINNPNSRVYTVPIKCIANSKCNINIHDNNIYCNNIGIETQSANPSDIDNIYFVGNIFNNIIESVVDNTFQGGMGISAVGYAKGINIYGNKIKAPRYCIEYLYNTNINNNICEITITSPESFCLHASLSNNSELNSIVTDNYCIGNCRIYNVDKVILSNNYIKGYLYIANCTKCVIANNSIDYSGQRSIILIGSYNTIINNTFIIDNIAISSVTSSINIINAQASANQITKNNRIINNIINIGNLDLVKSNIYRYYIVNTSQIINETDRKTNIELNNITIGINDYNYGDGTEKLYNNERNNGDKYYNLTYNKATFWNNSFNKFIDANGRSIIKNYGDETDVSNLNEDNDLGYYYFSTKDNEPKYYFNGKFNSFKEHNKIIYTQRSNSDKYFKINISSNNFAHISFICGSPDSGLYNICKAEFIAYSNSTHKTPRIVFKEFIKYVDNNTTTVSYIDNSDDSISIYIKLQAYYYYNIIIYPELKYEIVNELPDGCTTYSALTIRKNNIDSIDISNYPNSTEIAPTTVLIHNRAHYIANKKVVDVNGFTAVENISGNSNVRPTNLTSNDSGFTFYDTTLNKPIWWTGTKWVDSTGADV